MSNADVILEIPYIPPIKKTDWDIPIQERWHREIELQRIWNGIIQKAVDKVGKPVTECRKAYIEVMTPNEEDRNLDFVVKGLKARRVISDKAEVSYWRVVEKKKGLRVYLWR